jgi:hypothetical protein
MRRSVTLLVAALAAGCGSPEPVGRATFSELSSVDRARVEASTATPSLLEAQSEVGPPLETPWEYALRKNALSFDAIAGMSQEEVLRVVGPRSIAGVYQQPAGVSGVEDWSLDRWQRWQSLHFVSGRLDSGITWDGKVEPFPWRTMWAGGPEPSEKQRRRLATPTGAVLTQLAEEARNDADLAPAEP